jgi:hypothetical protein
MLIKETHAGIISGIEELWEATAPIFQKKASLSLASAKVLAGSISMLFKKAGAVPIIGKLNG